MRRALLPLLSAAVLFGLSAQVLAADDAQAILLKAIKAHGGEKVLARYKASQSKTKGTIQIPGLGEVEFTQEISVMAPDKYKDVVELEINGKQVGIVTIVNGKKISIEAAGKKVEITDAIKRAIQEAQYVLKATRLETLLKDKKYTLETLGEIKVEGESALGVRVTSKGQTDLNLYFNKETGLLAKTERRTSDPMTEQEFTEDRIVVEYQKKNKEGLTLPKKVLVKRYSKTYLETEVTESKVLEKLEDSEFEK